MSFVVSIDLDHWAEVVFVRFLHSGELLFTPFLCHALGVAVWGTYLGVGWGPVGGGTDRICHRLGESREVLAFGDY